MLRGLLNWRNWFQLYIFLISSNESFRINMAVVTQFDLDLHQTDANSIFKWPAFWRSVYVSAKSFETKGKEHMVCGTKKSFYGLKQASVCTLNILSFKIKKVWISVFLLSLLVISLLFWYCKLIIFFLLVMILVFSWNKRPGLKILCARYWNS